MMLEKIISGGQTGADQGGLEAAKVLGLKTGGTAPRLYMTENGTCLKLKDIYDLVEGPYDPKIYPMRTRKNIEDSDGTLLVGNVDSPGSKLTLRYCKELNKPVIINPGTTYVFLRWLRDWDVKILNVAGNRESKQPGIQAMTKNFLTLSLLDCPHPEEKDCDLCQTNCSYKRWLLKEAPK